MMAQMQSFKERPPSGDDKSKDLKIMDVQKLMNATPQIAVKDWLKPEPMRQWMEQIKKEVKDYPSVKWQEIVLKGTELVRTKIPEDSVRSQIPSFAVFEAKVLEKMTSKECSQTQMAPSSCWKNYVTLNVH